MRLPNLNLNNSFFDELEGFYAPYQPAQCSSPELIYFNQKLANELGLSKLEAPNASEQKQLAAFFSGNHLDSSCQPIAQAYAGHQFGQYNPQLGDGRALILGEQITPAGERIDLCLKGSGRTPFSRGGDGLAALGPMLREVLIAEFMHAVGIPTTRSLAVVTTGDEVYRDRVAPGAVLTRTATSHIRIGTFEFFARRGLEPLKKLTDYSISRHFPEIDELEGAEKYLSFLNGVCDKQAHTVAKWMSVGFIHGVMNTDNMLISGETIDYGPCAFMEAYDPDAVFSSIDHQGRYAYKNQPAIAQWNLSRLAECLIPIMSDGTQRSTDSIVERAKEVLSKFQLEYQHQNLRLFSQKLGLNEAISLEEREQLIESWLTLLKSQEVDFTNAFRALGNSLDSSCESLTELFRDHSALEDWLNRWRKTLFKHEKNHDHIYSMINKNNPSIIPRNHRVEEAIQFSNHADTNFDLSQFQTLLDALGEPYMERPPNEVLTAPASAKFTAMYQTFCGT